MFPFHTKLYLSLNWPDSRVVVHKSLMLIVPQFPLMQDRGCDTCTQGHGRGRAAIKSTDSHPHGPGL